MAAPPGKAGAKSRRPAAGTPFWSTSFSESWRFPVARCRPAVPSLLPAPPPPGGGWGQGGDDNFQSCEPYSDAFFLELFLPQAANLLLPTAGKTLLLAGRCA